MASNIIFTQRRTLVTWTDMCKFELIFGGMSARILSIDTEHCSWSVKVQMSVVPRKRWQCEISEVWTRRERGHSNAPTVKGWPLGKVGRELWEVWKYYFNKDTLSMMLEVYMNKKMARPINYVVGKVRWYGMTIWTPARTHVWFKMGMNGWALRHVKSMLGCCTIIISPSETTKSALVHVYWTVWRATTRKPKTAMECKVEVTKI